MINRIIDFSLKNRLADARLLSILQIQIGEQRVDLEKVKIVFNNGTKYNIADIEKKELAVIDGLHDIDYTLNTKKKEVADLKFAIAGIEKKIDLNANRSRELAQEIQNNKTYASRRIVALYKLNQLGKLNYLASADSMYQFFYRRTLLETVLEEDWKIQW